MLYLVTIDALGVMYQRLRIEVTGIAVYTAVAWWVAAGAGIAVWRTRQRSR